MRRPGLQTTGNDTSHVRHQQKSQSALFVSCFPATQRAFVLIYSITQHTFQRSDMKRQMKRQKAVVAAFILLSWYAMVAYMYQRTLTNLRCMTNPGSGSCCGTRLEEFDSLFSTLRVLRTHWLLFFRTR